MSVHPIREYPDPVLRGNAEQVKEFGESLKKLIGDMWETMKEYDGVGLAAPQIGISLQIAVVGWKNRRIVLVNPKVIEYAGEDFQEAGCLSAPGIYEKVGRPERVVVEAQDVHGDPFRLEETGYLARAILHEIDHLQGKLFIDRLSPLKRRFLKRKLDKRGEE